MRRQITFCGVFLWLALSLGGAARAAEPVFASLTETEAREALEECVVARAFLRQSAPLLCSPRLQRAARPWVVANLIPQPVRGWWWEQSAFAPTDECSVRLSPRSPPVI